MAFFLFCLGSLSVVCEVSRPVVLRINPYGSIVCIRLEGMFSASLPFVSAGSTLLMYVTAKVRLFILPPNKSLEKFLLLAKDVR